MKNLKKKGFTIVELVIVIAVIAILSAVLIPTFSSLIKKANLSNDKQAVRNMNTVLVTYIEPENEISDIMTHLRNSGYSYEKMIAFSKGFHYCYSKTTNQMYLVDDNNEVIFPENSDIDKSDLWSAYGNHATYMIPGISKYYAICEITSQEEFDSSFGSGTYTLDLNNNLCTVTGNANVSVMNGSVIGSGFASSDNVVEVKESNANNTVVTKNENGKISKVVYTNVLNPEGVASGSTKYADGSYIEYVNCVFTIHLGIYQNSQGLNVSFKDCTFININSFGLTLQPGGEGKTSNVDIDYCSFINCNRGINISDWEYTTVNISNSTFALKTGNSAYNCIQISNYDVTLQSAGCANEDYDELATLKINFSNNKVSSANGVVYYHDGMTGPQNLETFKSILNFTNNDYAEGVDLIADRGEYAEGHLLYNNETAMNELKTLIK